MDNTLSGKILDETEKQVIEKIIDIDGMCELHKTLLAKTFPLRQDLILLARFVLCRVIRIRLQDSESTFRGAEVLTW